jgi:hypothetical protein
VLTVLAGPWGPGRPRLAGRGALARGAARDRSGSAGKPAEYDITIPKAWGKVLYYGGGNFVLEDKDGVMREVDVRGRPPEYPKVKSIVRRGE